MKNRRNDDRFREFPSVKSHGAVRKYRVRVYRVYILLSSLYARESVICDFTYSTHPRAINPFLRQNGDNDDPFILIFVIVNPVVEQKNETTLVCSYVLFVFGFHAQTTAADRGGDNVCSRHRDKSQNIIAPINTRFINPHISGVFRILSRVGVG